MRLLVLSVFLSLYIVTGCEEKVNSASSSSKIYESEDFHTYWYAGKAEVSSYSLVQSRYGETRTGDAVLIFVTEDLSRKNQVKLDHPEDAGIDKVNVLKLNFTKNFVTGIYPYSMMLSVFTPVDRVQDQSSQKVAMSVQEWCGQAYTQMNLRGNRYNIKSHSYFETEGDESLSLKKVFLEDEIWNVIRIDHHHLPEGNIRILPGLFFTRLNHTDLQSESAMAGKSETDSTFNYTVNFTTLHRTLSIDFEKTFPYRILRWEEAWSEKGREMQARGKLRKTFYTDYWTKNTNAHEHLRDSLGLR